MGVTEPRDGLGEVGVTTPPRMDCVLVGKTETLCDLGGSDELCHVDLPRHAPDAIRRGCAWAVSYCCATRSSHPKCEAPGAAGTARRRGRHHRRCRRWLTLPPSSGSFVDLYVLGRVARGEVARSTARLERYALCDLAVSVGSVMPVVSVERADVQRWVDGMGPVQHRTRVQRLAMARRFFESLVDARAIPRNVASGVVAGDAPAGQRKTTGPLASPTAPIVGEYLQHLHGRGLRASTINQRRCSLGRLERPAVEAAQGRDFAATGLGSHRAVQERREIAAGRLE